MFAPDAAAGAGAGYSTMVDKDASQETTLGSAYSPVDYMSITSFPRLPEDDTISGENTLKSRRDEDNFLSEQDTGRARSQFSLQVLKHQLCGNLQRHKVGLRGMARILVL